jgi:hypothetical protein
MTWVIVILTICGNGGECVGERASDRSFTTYHACQRAAAKLENTQDWALVCVPQK